MTTTEDVPVTGVQAGPPATGHGGWPAPERPEVWVVLQQCERMGHVGVVLDVLSADPGPDYPERVAVARQVLRDPLPAGSYIEVVQATVQAPPWRPR